MALDVKTVELIEGSDFQNQDRVVVGKKSNITNTGSPGSVTSVTITNSGSNYSSIPVVSTTGNGGGATLQPRMKAVSATLQNAGTGYAPGDTYTIAGGISTSTAVITVNTVGAGGAIATFTVSTGGVYTVLPSNPVSQSSTSGVGTGATFLVLYGVDSIFIPSSGGAGYDNTSALVISGGGGVGAAGTLNIGSNTGVAVTTPVLFGANANLPANYSVAVNPGQACFWHVPQNSKTATGFNVVLTPKDSSSTIVAGSFDVIVEV